MAKISKTGIFLKKGFRVKLYPLLVSNLMQNIKQMYWANLEQYIKKLFFPTALPTFAPFCPFLGEKCIFSEKWQRLMVFYLYAKKYKKRLNGSKDSNLKIKLFLKYCPSLHPFLGVKEIEKKLSISFQKYISRAIQIWNQIFKILAVVLDIGV